MTDNISQWEEYVDSQLQAAVHDRATARQMSVSVIGEDEARRAALRNRLHCLYDRKEGNFWFRQDRFGPPLTPEEKAYLRVIA